MDEMGSRAAFWALRDVPIPAGSAQSEPLRLGSVLTLVERVIDQNGKLVGPKRRELRHRHTSMEAKSCTKLLTYWCRTRRQRPFRTTHLGCAQMASRTSLRLKWKAKYACNGGQSRPNTGLEFVGASHFQKNWHSKLSDPRYLEIFVLKTSRLVSLTA